MKIGDEVWFFRHVDSDCGEPVDFSRDDLRLESAKITFINESFIGCQDYMIGIYSTACFFKTKHEAIEKFRSIYI